MKHRAYVNSADGRIKCKRNLTTLALFGRIWGFSMPQIPSDINIPYSRSRALSVDSLRLNTCITKNFAHPICECRPVCFLRGYLWRRVAFLLCYLWRASRFFSVIGGCASCCLSDSCGGASCFCPGAVGGASCFFLGAVGGASCIFAIDGVGDSSFPRPIVVILVTSRSPVAVFRVASRAMVVLSLKLF